MDELTARYRAMPDEQLLKALSEKYKYQPDAIAAAEAEAISRGMQLELIEQKEASRLQPEQSWSNQLSAALLPGGGEKARADVLDWLPGEVEETTKATRIINQMMVGLFILMLLDVLGSWSTFREFSFLGTLYAIISISSVIIIPALGIAGLWNRAKFGLYLAAGLVVFTLIASVAELATLSQFTAEDYTNLFGMDYPVVIASLVISTLLALAIGWGISREQVYRLFGFERTGMILCFVWGSLGLMVVYALLFYGMFTLGY